MRGLLSGLLLATAVIGCDSTPKPPNVSLDQRSASPAGDEALTGQVVEHIAASPYSYVRIRTSKGDVWAAVNEARIEKGSQVTVSFDGQRIGNGSFALNGGCGSGIVLRVWSASVRFRDVTVTAL